LHFTAGEVLEAPQQVLPLSPQARHTYVAEVLT
jgi:hypothetical protein